MAKKTEKRSFVLYHAIRKPLEKLNDEQRGQLFLAILNYSEFGTEPDFADSSVDIAFEFIRDALDKDTAAWEEKSQRRAEAGSKGGKQKVANQANATFAKQNIANQAVSVSVSGSVSVSDSKENEKKKKQFAPPTLEEVREYCKQRNSTVDPVQFWEYFNAGGWKDSKGQQVKSWRQKLLTWEKFQPAAKKKSPYSVNGQDCNDGTAAIDLSDLKSLLGKGGQ